MSSPNNVMDICRQLLDEYNPNLSPAHYVQDLKILKEMSNFDYEKNFICEVFYGCCDKVDSLDVIINGYYAKDGKSCLNSEKNYFKIYAYICIYRLDDYGMEELKIMTSLWHQEKTLKFLTFLSDDKNLLTWIKSAWSGLYNPDYVSKRLLKPFMNYLPELHDFLKTLSMKVYAAGVKKPKPPTEPEPFDLKTNQIVRKVLLPEKVENQPRKERKFLTSAEKEQKLKKLDDLERRVQPKYKIRTKPLNKKQGQESDDDSEDDFKVPIFKATPFKPTQNTASVKLNTAVVLREEHVIKRQTETILKKFDYLENGDRNEDEFLNWQSEMKMNDLRAEIEESEMKKLQSKISYENAKLAKEDAANINKLIAREVAYQNEILNKKRMEMKLQEDIMNRQNAMEIKEYEKYVISTVKEEVINSKKAIAQEVAKESAELQERAFKEAEIEMAKKIELIQQIKAAESISVDRTKPVDLTSTAGHRLLSEMSISELYERLELVRQEEELNKMKIHDDIIKNKVEKEHNIVEKLHYINKFRNENAILEKKMKIVSAGDLREQIKREMQIKNPAIQNLKNKLVETKAETKLINKTFTKKKNTPTTYADQRKILEWERMKDLERKMEIKANIV